jgi:hypothetical protein
VGQLRAKMREDREFEDSAPTPLRPDLRCVQTFAKHFGRSHATMGAAEIRPLLLVLIRARKGHPATSNVYAGAIKFLYRVTLGRPDRAGSQGASLRVGRAPAERATGPTRGARWAWRQHGDGAARASSMGLRKPTSPHPPPGDANPPKL